MENKFKLKLFLSLVIGAIIFISGASLTQNQVRATCGSDCSGPPHCEVCDNTATNPADWSCLQCGGGGGDIIYGECANNSQCGQECCNGGQCGACGAGAGNCPAGQSLQCGSVTAEGCISVNYKQECFDRDAWNYGSACGVVGKNCQTNCGCCPAGTIRSTGSTYNTAAWSYPVGDPGNPATRWHCNSTNDEYLSSTNSSWWWNYNANPEGYYVTRYNTCRTATCVVPPPTNPIASCPAPGTSANLSWDDIGADQYAVRLYRPAEGSPWSCGPPLGHQCIDRFTNSWSPSTTATHTYAWKVQSKTSTGLLSADVYGPNFTCTNPINGGWTAWSACSVTACGSTGTQTRTCTNPTPQYGGANCSGLDGGNSSRACSTAACPPTASCSVSPNPVAYGGNPGIILTSTNAYYCHVYNNWSEVESGYFTGGTHYPGAQTSAGANSAMVYCYNSNWVGSGWNYCSYTVNVPVINGACGSSNGGNFYTAPSAPPTSNLCATGTPSVVSGSGPWNWTCVGSGGGGTASCSANKKVDGVWNVWSIASSACGVSGTQTRYCNNPAPANGGLLCTLLDGSLGIIESRPYINPPCSWWQVKDGDVTTNEDLTSKVPTSQYFGTLGSGGFAGVPVYGTTFNLVTLATPDKISASAAKWNANTLTTASRVFNYSYFKNLIPDDVVSGQIYSDGYKWTMITGDYTLPTTNFGSTKNILFVNGNLNINGNINVDDGAGFFAVFVSGNITVAPSVTGTPSIEGIYLSDGAFNTGSGGIQQLHVRGSVASFGGISLLRDLLDDSVTPSELFEFAPDQIALFPEKLGYRGQRWAEVAP